MCSVVISLLGSTLFGLGRLIVNTSRVPSMLMLMRMNMFLMLLVRRLLSCCLSVCGTLLECVLLSDMVCTEICVVLSTVGLHYVLLLWKLKISMLLGWISGKCVLTCASVLGLRLAVSVRLTLVVVLRWARCGRSRLWRLLTKIRLKWLWWPSVNVDLSSMS